MPFEHYRHCASFLCVFAADTVYLLKYEYKSMYMLSFQRAVARVARPLLPVQLATINIDQAVQDGHAFVRRFDSEIDNLVRSLLCQRVQ